MKTLLVNPPCEHVIRESLPSVVEDDTGVFPPLGLLYVAAHAESVADVDVTVLDCQAQGIGHEGFAAHVQRIEPDVVGIQVMTFTLIDAIMIARAIKRVRPSALVVFGGPHVTIYPRESAQLDAVDAVVPGEGEYVFVDLLNAYKRGDPLESVPGVVTSDNAGHAAARSLRYIHDLDAIRMPARHHIEMDRYVSPMARKNPVTTMMSSRGCPARCIFCDRPQMGKVFRKRSPQSVVDEMQHCADELGVGEIVFYDDTFTIDRRRVIDICDGILDRRLQVNWDIRARIDTVTPEMIDKLREAGCYRIHYGVESGSPRIQKRLRKNLDLSKVKDVFARTRKAGIETLGYFMIGCPDETDAELQQTVDLMLFLPMDYAHIGIFTPYPGTAIYAEALASGVYDHDYWHRFAQAPTEDFTPKYWNQHFTDQQLQGRLREAYLRFYRRPGYIVQRLLRIRSFEELMKKGCLGAKLLYGMSVGKNRQSKAA